MPIDLLYSDLHLRNDRLDVASKVLDGIFKIGERAGVLESGGAFLNGGDTFHVRGMIPTSAMDLLYKKRREWKKRGVLTHVDNIGNHDQEDREGEIHPMMVFEELGDGWIVADKPLYLKSLHYYVIPYCTHLSRLLKGIPTELRKGLVALVHTGVKGAYLNNQRRDDFSLEVDAFDGFKRVFSGHYHKHHSLNDRFTYIGSPNQHTAAERDQAKGVVIYDRDSDVFSHYPIGGTPSFHEAKVWWEDDEIQFSRPKRISPGDTVLVHVNGTSDQVRSFKSKSLGLECHVKISRHTKDVTQSRLNVDSEDDKVSLLKSYVDYMDPGLDTKRLFSIGRKFLEA